MKTYLALAVPFAVLMLLVGCAQPAPANTPAPSRTATPTSSPTPGPTPAPTQAPSPGYKLAHSAADAEYILGWDSIVALCPDIAGFDELEGFAYRGGTLRFASGDTAGSLNEDSPVAWSSLRGVRMGPEGDRFRSFGAWISFVETGEELDEYVQLMQGRGLLFQQDGDFVTAVLEVGSPPTASIQLHSAGNHFHILFVDIASSGESLFCGRERLVELLSIAKNNVSSLEISPLPPDIPGRKPIGTPSDELHEIIMTVRSDELPTPVQVPGDRHYNSLWFDVRPLMQQVNFSVDKDWQYIITVTGEVGTKFEITTRTTQPGEQWSSESSAEAFSLYSDTLTITRSYSLGERFLPPVEVEMTVLFDTAMAWTITIAE